MDRYIDSETNQIIYKCQICGKEVPGEKVGEYLRQEFDIKIPSWRMREH